MKSINISYLTKKIKFLYKKHKDEVNDIILFGSFMRGNAAPNDIDILLIFKNKINKDIEYELKTSLSQIYINQAQLNISIVSKTEESYTEESFDAREGILFEGYSLVKSKYIASNFGYSSFGMFIYDTNPLKPKQKTLFYYALNGRNASGGVIKMLDAIKLSNNIIIVPLHKIELAKEFFEYRKIEYKYVPTLIPHRLGKTHILNKNR